MSTAAHRYAQAMAVTERARGRAEEARAWLDLLALLDAPAPAPSVVSDAAGLGDRIAALSARLAAVGFPACTCHPGDDDSERCLPSPQDWRAEITNARNVLPLCSTGALLRKDWMIARTVDSVQFAFIFSRSNPWCPSGCFHSLTSTPMRMRRFMVSAFAR